MYPTLARYGPAFIVVLAIAPLLIHYASAQTCIETASCAMTANPLDWLVEPVKMTFGDWTYLIVWGLIIGPLYMRSGHPLMVAVIGVLIMLSLTATTNVRQSLSDAFFYGIMLMIVPLGLVAFSVYRRGATGGASS